VDREKKKSRSDRVSGRLSGNLCAYFYEMIPVARVPESELDQAHIMLLPLQPCDWHRRVASSPLKTCRCFLRGQYEVNTRTRKRKQVSQP